MSDKQNINGAETPGPEEIKRKKRRLERLAIAAAVLAILGLTMIQTYVVKLGAGVPLSQGLLVFVLINVNIVLLLVLLFLVLRNLYKIFFEEKQVTRAQLRTKLVVAFVSLSLVPTCLLFYSALQFTATGHDYWFDENVERSLADSLALAQYTADQYEGFTLDAGEVIRSDLLDSSLYLSENEEQLQLFIQSERRRYRFNLIEIYSPGLELRLADYSAGLNEMHAPPLSIALFSEALAQGKPRVRVDTLGQRDFIRVVWPLVVEKSGLVGFMVVGYESATPTKQKTTAVSQGLKRYRELKRLHDPIRVSSYIALTIVALLSIFISTWIGFHLAKSITGPIMDLAKATERIGQGDYDFTMDPGTSAVEISTLVDSFNRMTQELNTNKTQLTAKNEELNERNRELDQRRKYMEIILQNVAAGVVSTDSDGDVATINNSAREILQISGEDILGRPLNQLLPEKFRDRLDGLIRAARRSFRGVAEKQIRLQIDNHPLSLHMHFTQLRDAEGRDLGAVVVFDDMSDLEKAQRMDAWREVARRIAHEIKNPLTPIQLSTQRLRRRYSDRLSDDGQLFDECTQMIIRQVEDLKRLVNEFSNFARLPEANPTPNDLADIVEETVVMYGQSHKDVTIEVARDKELPIFNIDREQMTRALINLLDNAVAAVNGQGKIDISINFDRLLRMVRLEVADDGVGISPQDKRRLFEPYFSTKKSGTGLGLAIVSTIVADHDGFVRVHDNLPRGTRFIIELPVKI